MLKAIRRRIGVSAPKLSIRPEVPLHWRALSVLLLSAVALALAGWIYDAGRRFAGFDQSQSGEKLVELQSEILHLRQELAEVTVVADSSAARLKVEATAQDRLAIAVRNLEEENARIKSELAVFESLAGNEQAIPSISISRFEVLGSGEPRLFKYRFLATKSGSGGERNFKGRLELVLSVRNGDQLDIVTQSGKDGELSYPLQYRFFKRVDGKFFVPGQGILEAVEARLLEDGQIRALQRINVIKR